MKFKLTIACALLGGSACIHAGYECQDIYSLATPEAAGGVRFYILKNSLDRLDESLIIDDFFPTEYFDSNADPQVSLLRLRDNGFAALSRAGDEASQKIFYKDLSPRLSDRFSSLIHDNAEQSDRYQLESPTAIQLRYQTIGSGEQQAQLRNGDILAAFTRIDTSGYDGTPFKACTKTAGCLHNKETLLYRSSDLGRSWAFWSSVEHNPLEQQPGDHGPNDPSHRGGPSQPIPIELRDGTIGLLVTEQWNGIHEQDAEQCETYRGPHKKPYSLFRDDTISFFISEDGGRTWPSNRRYNVYTGPCGSSNQDAHIALLSGSELAVVFTSADRDIATRQRRPHISVTTSSDLGQNWSIPHPLVSAEAWNIIQHDPSVHIVGTELIVRHIETARDTGLVGTVFHKRDLQSATEWGADIVTRIIGPGTISPECLDVNSVPNANAGMDQTVTAGSRVQLSGENSTDDDGDPLEYAWSFLTRPAGSDAALDSAASISPTFMADVPGLYELQLNVIDPHLANAADTVHITAEAQPEDPPTAPGLEYGFDGTTGDLGLHWSHPGDPDDALEVSIRALKNHSTTREPARIHRNTQNGLGVFNAPSRHLLGNQEALLFDWSPNTVDLLGVRVFASSIANGPVMDIYADGQWVHSIGGQELAKSALRYVDLSSIGIQARELAIVGKSTADGFRVKGLNVHLAARNQAPTANAGADQSMVTGATAALDASGSSDPEGDALHYSWAFVTRPLGSQAKLDDATSATPKFSADMDGDYRLRLIVSDGFYDSIPDEIIIESRTARDAGRLTHDQFIASRDTDLANHISDSGHAWVRHPHWPDSTIRVLAVEDRLQRAEPGAAAYYIDAASLSTGGSYAEALFHTQTDGNNSAGLLLGFTKGAAPSGYMVLFKGGQDLIYLLRYREGSATKIHEIPFAFHEDVNYRLRGEVRDQGHGAELRILVNGEEMGRYLDAPGITPIGHAGIYMTNPAWRIEDFHSGGLHGGNGIEAWEYQSGRVFQRSGSFARIELNGEYSGAPHFIEARILKGDSEVVGWTVLDRSPENGRFSGFLLAPEGGWYTTQVRFSNQTHIHWSSVFKYAVGARYLIVGQSNAAGWFMKGEYLWPHKDLRTVAKGSAFPIDAGNGAIACGNRLIENLGVPITLLQNSVGSTALRQVADSGSGYWLDRSAGSVYDKAIKAAKRDDNGVEGVIWIQGERDARHGGLQADDYAEALRDFLSNLRTDLQAPRLPVYVSLLGRGASPKDQDTYFNAVRIGQIRTIRNDADSYIGATTADLALIDQYHYTNRAYIRHGERIAQSIAHRLGTQDYHRGPVKKRLQLVNAETIDVYIQHHGGTDFTPATDISGFEVFDDAQPVPLAGVDRLDAGRLRLTLSGPISGTATLRYLYGANPDVGAAVRDNSELGLPLEAIQKTRVTPLP